MSSKKIPLKEKGMGELLSHIYRTFNESLSHEMLFEWFRILMQADPKLANTHSYRTFEDPMQIISGRYDKPTVYFEAPPSSAVLKEMTKFISWFNEIGQKLSLFERAVITHLYFESIHPFEDGNGCIGRALVEKALSQGLGHPTLISISQIINNNKKEYYKALGSCNRSLDIQE